MQAEEHGEGATSRLTRELLLPFLQRKVQVSGNLAGNEWDNSMTVLFNRTQESGLPPPPFPCGLQAENFKQLP